MLATINDEPARKVLAELPLSELAASNLSDPRRDKLGVTLSVPRWITPSDPLIPVERLHHPPSPASEDDAFASFYHEHAPRVYMLALRLCGDANDAREVLSETFVSAWRGLSRFRGDSSASTWLHTITVRAWRGLQRRRHRGRPMVALDESAFGIAAQYDEPGNRLDIEQAVASLPEGAREVLVLFAIEGYSHGEIASILGISVGTVKSQVHRARKLLLQRLER